FFRNESCGQCTPCREGSIWVTRTLERIEAGRGTEDDLDTLMELTAQMVGTTICVLSDSVAAPVQSSVLKFRDEYLALIRRGERVGTA
ncbi:MAG TPA: NADH-quinone oxidoreductase subunit F, partial [Gemmatimonadetes bacterium]|nr:NADH-quinone oxidoreductase subunit F [Gemmatimonadota bacterium]